MSCQIKLTACISDIPGIRRCLFPTDDLRGTDSWLQLCESSVSPTGDTIAIANEKRLVVLTAKWDSLACHNRFQTIFSGSLNDDESIRSVLCLPVVSQTQSSHVGPDWTCIAIGFESGFVRFYTDDCQLLFSEQLHNESVCSIKCQSQHSPRPDVTFELKPEEIYVQYPNNVCIISGSHLFNTLRNCRSVLARGHIKADITEQTSTSTNSKKWGFVDQFIVNDAVVVGLDLANTFDHLLTASTNGGFDTRYRAMAPHNNLVLGAGSKPFIGFHYALEGGTQPVLTDVAKAVANKLKSALPGWLTGNKTQSEKQMTTASQPSEPMGCRFGICDLRRTAVSIILSPDRRLAAAADALGRVMLVDSHKGVVLRMLKGYREAQCAFIQVPDEKKSKHRSSTRVAMFLIIYSPKKGTLEIFSAQQGLKIATFTASKYSCLFYINYGLMGFSNTSKSRYVCQYTCVLMDSDGQLKEIVIPFHYALTEKNSKRARDIHLHKRLKHFIKSCTYSGPQFTSEALNTCTELKTSEIKLQCLETLMNSKEIAPDVILRCSEYFLQKLNSLQTDEVDSETRNLMTLSENLHQLVEFYIFVADALGEELDEENGNLVDSDSLKSLSLGKADTKLVINAKDMHNLQRLLDLSTLDNMKMSTELKVSFHDQVSFSFSQFLSVFELSVGGKIFLKRNLDEAKLFRASEIIFQRYVSLNQSNFDALQSCINQSKIVIKDLFELALYYWVNRPLNIGVNLENEMQNLSQLIYTLSKTTNIDDMTVKYNRMSPFWVEIRDILANSARPFPSLMAALICRSVAQRIECEKELQQSGTSLEDENIEIWEKLSQENCEWMLLIGKLEDVSLLNIILANKPFCDDPAWCCLPKLKCDQVDISLKYILRKGRGSVSELVATWLASAGISPKKIIDNDCGPDDASQTGSTNKSYEEQDSERLTEFDQPIFEHLNIIKKQFPYSAQSSVLIANLCWEYALSWQKQIQEFSYLESAMSCLSCNTDAHIRQGLHNLVWNTHLKLIFESSCKLINKVGKLPKEKLCWQDTGLSDFQIVRFIEICTDFFDAFMDAIQQSCNSPKKPLKYEAIWENGGQPPLTELALQQNQINYDLVHLHYQLSLVMQMMTKFVIKHTKPINNLFDNIVVGLLFTDLQQKTQINWHKSESKVLSSRTQFLIKVISASIETVTVNENKIYFTEHVTWMSKCLSLAKVWNLDVDLLKRYQIIQLFSNGFDSLAEELLSAVTDLNKLGPDLLVVCGKRLSQLISSSSDLGEKIAALSPNLTKYLNTLNGDWCAPSSLEGIVTVSTHCISCLNDDQAEQRLANQLLEACLTLQDVQRQCC